MVGTLKLTDDRVLQVAKGVVELLHLGRLVVRGVFCSKLPLTLV